ncbi:MAG: AmmeMemoRadiSam system protein A [Lachnospiraceae bacterium]|nr:AmmeMemoRadiSam system protein A [Lachnospiraceae bacterium]
MPIVGGVMVPHPPLIIPEVGKGKEKIIEKTARAYEKAADFVAELKPETIVIISPHSVMYADYLHISPGKEAAGDLSNFGAPEVRISREYDDELSKRMCELSIKGGVLAGYVGEQEPSLDHGTLIPLYFILKKYKDFKLVRTGISGRPLDEQYRFGMVIKQAAEELGRRVLIVASGDLSHKLKEDGPYGLEPEGLKYDEKIMDIMGKASFGELLGFNSVYLNKVAECGHRSFVIMGGAFDSLGVEAKSISHEGETGVGYGICTLKVLGKDPERNFLKKFYEEESKELEERKRREDEFVSLARRTVEAYVGKRQIIATPRDLPQVMYDDRAGAFVSLHIKGELRGCIGTIAPTMDCVAEEVIHNAISAATRDPRFPEVRSDELSKLEYSVDVLGAPEDISSQDELDVKKYGVIVSKGHRRGILLPDLEGVETVDEQIDIAKRKAGIAEEDEDVKLQRFEVIRHF